MTPSALQGCPPCRELIQGDLKERKIGDRGLRVRVRLEIGVSVMQLPHASVRGKCAN